MSDGIQPPAAEDKKGLARVILLALGGACILGAIVLYREHRVEDNECKSDGSCNLDDDIDEHWTRRVWLKNKSLL